jgi:predicted nicotinamide N-methyase
MAGNLPDGRALSGAEMTLKLTPGPDFRRFILENTSIQSPPHVPEIKLHLADEAHELWHRTEDELQASGLEPPFWAFAWAGGQGLARHVLDHPDCVKSKTVLDFATGSGLVAVAAHMSGAARVLAADIDPFSADAVSLNAGLNDCSLEHMANNLVGQDQGWDVILAGDVFYDRALAELLLPWFNALSARGADILIGDPGRAYLPKDRLAKLSEHQVQVTRALEDQDVRMTTVWRLKTAQ